ncbi:ABC transporter substrate-binding protein [Bacillus massiliglaciei]|uniref:ABC transporter substrate-binding protein n=1 Tax=Bacillus massiliglaciei TaxID=1816693 RepID=UPI000B0DB68B|nr:ABC transporter substrate-binding protein [Bacillus massiliglaciei]
MKLKYFKLLFVCIISIYLTGCGIAESAEDRKTLIIGIESETDVLDPHRAGGWVTFRVNYQMHESLVTEDLSTNAEKTPPLKAGLAEKWSVSDDGLIYTFHLRKGVTFHDGTSFDAKDVEFNIRRVWDKDFKYYDALSAGQVAATYANLEKINIIDDYTIQLVMDQPFAPFLRMLAQGGLGSSGIISPDALKKWGNDGYAEHPSGTGPFKFVERVRGEKIVLDKNEKYWGKKPNIDRVIFRPIPDASSRVLALESGGVDIISVPPPDSVKGLKEKGFKVVEGAAPHVWYLSMNFNNKEMQDKKVREAISLAIDREGMTKELLQNTVTPAKSVLSPANEAYDDKYDGYEYNPEKAKKLLKEAGYEEGFDTVFRTSVDGSGQLIPVQMAEWIQRDLAKIGIKVKIETYEWISYLGVYYQEAPEEIGFSQMSWGMSTPYILSIMSQSESNSNVGKYKNADADALMAKATAETDTERSNGYWRSANEKVTEDMGIIGVVNDKAPYAMSDKVEGFIVPNEEWFSLTDVKLK